MKKAFLIFLMLVLPFQAIATSERNFAHVMENGSKDSNDIALNHLLEHVKHVPHHHHDDGNTHEDDSAQSVQHLLDFDQDCSTNAVMPASAHLPMFFMPHPRPLFSPETIPNRTAIPLFRPPRLPA